jgi:hypothetical protein
VVVEEIEAECPYCGEAFETTVDCSAGDQAYIEDCPVCCRPIEFDIRVDGQGGLTSVQVRHQDE